MNPSRSQRCTVAVDTPSSLAAFAIVTTSPSSLVARTGQAGIPWWARSPATRWAVNGLPAPVRRRWRERIAAICLSG